MPINVSMSQTAPRIVCEVCHVILNYGGPQSQGETFVICDNCKKGSKGENFINFPPPESTKQ